MKLNCQANQIFGDDLKIEYKTADTSSILSKLSKPKKVKRDDTKILKSKEISLEEKLEIIKANVYRTLGSFKNNTQVIRTREELKKFIDTAILNGIISIDTETNNSLDPLTCKLMGPCLYTPGLKQAYIPINHVDPKTEELLPDQVTEQDIHEEFSRLDNTKIIMHHGKFDHNVILATTNTDLNIYWDTMIGAQILNENEPAGLKYQYSTKIDPTMEKYSIETFFKDIEYKYVDPEVFALYAAGDAYDTYKLYEYQLSEFTKPGNEKLFKLFLEIEMPVVMVTASMEYRGIALDKDFAQRLSNKFHSQLDINLKKVEEEMKTIQPKIDQWRLTPEANEKKIKLDKEGNPKLNKKGKPILSKSLNEQLSDPVELTSSQQLAILLYDVLKARVVNKEKPRSVDEATLLELGMPICKLILEQRELLKYLGTYIDKLPKVCNPKTGRIHAKFNQLGREDNNVVTGRMSSSEPNMQNIPSRGSCVTVRMMFVPSIEYHDIDSNDGSSFIVRECDEIELLNGEWKFPENISKGDKLVTGEEILSVERISDNSFNVILCNNL